MLTSAGTSGSCTSLGHRFIFLHSSCLFLPSVQTSCLFTSALFSQLIILTFLSSILKLIGNHFKHNSPKMQFSSLSLCTVPIKANPGSPRSYFLPSLLLLSLVRKQVWRKSCIYKLSLYLNAQSLNSGESLVLLSFISVNLISSFYYSHSSSDNPLPLALGLLLVTFFFKQNPSPTM